MEISEVYSCAAHATGTSLGKFQTLILRLAEKTQTSSYSTCGLEPTSLSGWKVLQHGKATSVVGAPPARGRRAEESLGLAQKPPRTFSRGKTPSPKSKLARSRSRSRRAELALEERHGRGADEARVRVHAEEHDVLVRQVARGEV